MIKMGWRIELAGKEFHLIATDILELFLLSFSALYREYTKYMIGISE